MLLKGQHINARDVNASVCVFVRKETLRDQSEEKSTDKEKEKNVVTRSEEKIDDDTTNGMSYERVYLPETDTSEGEDSDDSNSSDDYYY